MTLKIERLCVFCGSSSGGRPRYETIARELGAAVARESITLVYGGGNVGLMGMLADSALAHGGKVIGVITQALLDKELAHAGLSELRVVDSMHERKAMMADLADGFIALPGGVGTLEEFCEMLTWAQLGIHRKPCCLLNVAGYYDRFIEFLDHAVAEGFLKPKHRRVMMVETEPAEAIVRLQRFEPPPVNGKWDGLGAI